MSCMQQGNIYMNPARSTAKNWARIWLLLGAAAGGASFAVPARAETISLYSAGSLRHAVAALVKEAGLPADVEVKSTFGGSGSLRQRIESGESPDLFLSADMTAPRTLADAGRAIAPAIAFARNAMCLIARRSAGVTPDNLADRLLAKELRLVASTPVQDPAGDYAIAIFDRIDSIHPGAGAVLRAKAQHLAGAQNPVPPVPGHGAAASLFINNQTDLMIAYCSGAAAIEKEAPDVTSIAFPSSLDVHPIDGMAILSMNPNALRLALFILSEKGQAILKEAGLAPILETAR
jgi:molybdate transport system substrate-binding protein